MKTFQSNSAENFSWRHVVNARLPGKMAGASPKLLLHTGMRAPKPVCFRSVPGGWRVPGVCPDCRDGGVRAVGRVEALPDIFCKSF